MLSYFKIFFNVVFVIFFFSTALAFSPESRLENIKDEKRAHKLFLQIRCLVCKGQVIESSDNEFARVMRQDIRNKILQNRSDKEIKDYLVWKYGDDILVKNIFPLGYFLIVLFLTSVIIVYFFLRSPSK